MSQISPLLDAKHPLRVCPTASVKHSSFLGVAFIEIIVSQLSHGIRLSVGPVAGDRLTEPRENRIKK